MNGALFAVVVVIGTALVFAYTNGFHDAANAIAVAVSTRALTPRIALGIAAVGNLVGSYLGARVAKTVGEGLVTLPRGLASLGVVFAGVFGAIVWNLVTWYFGLPSSSSHALFGGLVGASVFATGGIVHWGVITGKVIVPMVLSPVVGLLLGFVAMLAIMWLFRKGHPRRLNGRFRQAQRASAFAMALGHGMQDAAKTMGIVVLALYTGGLQDSRTSIPAWVFVGTALVMALGTYAGGWRIIKTIGGKVLALGQAEGFAAQTVASSVLYFNSLVLGAPISTTHTITSAIMGVGATKRLSAVRWGVAGNIVGGWILTFPAAAAVAILTYLMIGQLFR
jgi:PiT family inorganic phosphate transporter